MGEITQDILAPIDNPLFLAFAWSFGVRVVLESRQHLGGSQGLHDWWLRGKLRHTHNRRVTQESQRRMVV